MRNFAERRLQCVRDNIEVTASWDAAIATFQHLAGSNRYPTAANGSRASRTATRLTFL